MDNQLQEKQNEIERLNALLENERRNLDVQLQQKQNEIQQVRVSSEGERNNLNLQIQQKDLDIAAKTAEFNKRLAEKDDVIVRKLSEDYAKYVTDEIIPEREGWQKRSFWSFVILSVTVLITIGAFIFWDSLSVDKKIALFSSDMIAVSLLWFCVSQYSYYTKLYTEYSNRRVVASSYIGVIGNTNDHEVKREAIKVIMDTLFSRSSAEIGSELPIKEITKLVTEILSKKG